MARPPEDRENGLASSPPGWAAGWKSYRYRTEAGKDVFGHLQNLGDGKEPHRYAHEAEPVQKRGDPVGEAFDAGGGVHADGAEKDPEGAGNQPLDHGFPHQGDDQGHSQGHQGKILRRAEADGEFGQRGRQQHQADHAQGPGDEGADGRYAQGRAGPAFLAHLVAVQAGHDRGGFPGKVHQDGGGRAAVHGPVVDAGQHDDGGGGIHAEGEGNEHGRPGHRPDAGQDPDDGPHGHAEKAEEEIGGGEDRGKTRNQVFEHVSIPLTFPGTRWGAETSATTGKWRRGRKCRPRWSAGSSGSGPCRGKGPWRQKNRNVEGT